MGGIVKILVYINCTLTVELKGGKILVVQAKRLATYFFLGCDICNENPEECPMHGPLHSLRKLVNQSQIDSPIDYSAILKFPDEVGLCTSSIPGIEYGVCAKAAIPSGTWIGPYEGRLVRPEQIKKGTETEYMWEVLKHLLHQV